METGFRGAFVISWSQTEVDGLIAAPIETLSVGASWAWRGEVVRVDGPNGILRLEGHDRHAARRKGAAKLVRRLVAAARDTRSNLHEVEVNEPLADTGFVVTDGLRTYTVTVIPVGNGSPPLLVFVDDLPPHERELWVVHHSLDALARNTTAPEAGGVICFTPGTRIETPCGPRLVEELREGDYVQTKDNGRQPVQWIGKRRMTGARLFAMPHLRPVRMRMGALGIHQPDQELLVSPEHRMLVKGAVARSLFNTPEVLVSAKDLVNNDTIAFDLAVREVTYIHLLLPRHQVLWANGVETESFHPASAALTTLDACDRERLLDINPAMEHEPHAYGGFARRSLSVSEAAILMHEAA
ncbi:Hint domain-containing protein [Roseovarius salis]|uniref:Hint domain-containing protein n=1 Tax=Roseovarius salis TaxID=3376063 RepID=UPI0037CC99A5